MTATREFVFDWLFNASMQVALFALFAAILLPLTVKAEARYQHCLYLVTFALCLTTPIVNTLWRTTPVDVAQKQLLQSTGHPRNHLWLSSAHSRPQQSILPAPAAKTVLLMLWQGSFLYQLARLSRGLYRVRRLRRDAVSISPSQIGQAGSIFNLPDRVALLQSTTIHEPVTIGVFRPAIILPTAMIPLLDGPDLTAILAHEYEHIRRRDYLVHLLCQVAALPLAWHPGMQYLMSKIAQTRELACDDYAAVRVGKRLVYARTLVRLASLCLQVRRGNAMGLGIFNGDNLEDRIMKLTQTRTSLSRAGLVGMALAITFIFGSGAALARATSLQGASAPTPAAQAFAGTWHWMFHGRSFSTMILVQNGSAITGTVTGSRIALDDRGELSRADPTDSSAPSPITATKLEGNALHVTVADDNRPFEFLVTLKDAGHAEIHPIGAPPEMKPIPAERAH